MKNNQAKESKRQRNERIAGTNNGTTLRTRVVPNKKKRTRIIKRVDWEIELEEEE